MGDRIEATTVISAKGRFVLIGVYQWEDGTLTVGTGLTITIDGRPFLPGDFTISRVEEVVRHHGVDSCLLLDLIGEENREGRLLDVNLVFD